MNGESQKKKIIQCESCLYSLLFTIKQYQNSWIADKCCCVNLTLQVRTLFLPLYSPIFVVVWGRAGYGIEMCTIYRTLYNPRCMVECYLSCFCAIFQDIQNIKIPNNFPITGKGKKFPRSHLFIVCNILA